MRKLWSICILILLLGGLGVAVWQGKRPAVQITPRLCVVNTLSQDLSVIDPGTNREVQRIPLHVNGYAVAVSRAGELAYVTAGAFPEAGVQWNKATAQLLEVDLAGGKVRRALRLPDLAPLARVHLSPEGRFAYLVTAGRPGERNTRRGQVLFVDLARQRVVARVRIGLNPLDSAMTPDGRTLFTADWTSRAVSVVNLRERRLEDTIPLGDISPRALAIAPDGRAVYAALDGPGDRLLAEIDTRTRTLTRLPFTAIRNASALAVATDGRVYIAGRDNRYSSELRDVYATQQLSRSASQLTSAHMHGEDVVAAYDPQHRRITQRYPASGYLPSLHTSGHRLYLIGTTAVPTIENARIMESVMMNAARLRSADTLRAASRRPKSVTVLDLPTGNTRAIIPIGSFPQGCGGTTAAGK